MGLDIGCFLGRLREETRADHERVERVVPVMRDDLDVAAYRQLLSRFYGYHAPVEARLETLAPHLPAGLDWVVRRKCPALRRDLLALGLDESNLERLPRCRAIPDLSRPARALGCLYVLEGASLGGQVICRHLERLAPEITRNRRFFCGYGEQTGVMWHAFRRALLRGVPTLAEQDEAIDAAHETFRTFAVWMSEERFAE